MPLSCAVCVVLLSTAAAAVERQPAASAASAAANNKQGWSPFEASRWYRMQTPTAVKYTPNEIDEFLFGIMKKLEDMPLPDDPRFEFVRERNKQVQACEIPEDDGDSMEFSANPDDVMETVMRSFADGKCAGRVFGEWYYQVCGNLAVKRSPFTVSSRKGKLKVTTFRAYEALGVLGRDRKVSRHHASVTEPRYVEQTYYDGARCNLDGDWRRMQTTVTFECSRRFVSGYVHLNEAVEEHPCKYRLQLQSADFCDNDWLYGFEEYNSVVRCRLYFHPERIKPLMTFLQKFQEEEAAKGRRHAKYMARPEVEAVYLRQLQRPDARERMRELAAQWVRLFEKDDAHYGLAAERQRILRNLDYVMSELTWASLNPDLPYTEEERRAREAEEKKGRKDDKRQLVKIRNMLESVRSEFLDDAESEDEREWYEIQPYTDLLQMADNVSLRDPYLDFYASWLDYIKFMQEEEWLVVRPLLIAPNRKPLSLEAFLLLESLIKSDYADSVRKVYSALREEEKEKELLLLYEGELDENDLEEIARRFMQVYREAKKGGDTLLFDLLDDEDFEY